jgi:hypothetical protein
MEHRAGGRVQLELLADEPERVRYSARLALPDVAFDGLATVGTADGSVSFDWPDGRLPPDWLLAFARAFLRSEWLARQKDPSHPWPARIRRWREGGAKPPPP